MSSTKRVSGNYNIYADNTIVNGNLTVMGTQSSIESVDTTIKDRVITLNSGEVGAGVTGNYSGLDIDRGSSTNVGLRWSEPDTAWQVTIDGTTWQDILTGTGGVASAAGSNGDIQFNTSGSLAADSAINWNNASNILTVNDLSFNAATISSVSTNSDIVLTPNGTGVLEVQAVTKLQDQGSNPSPTAGYTYLYSKSPGLNQTGLYYVNNTASGELPSTNKTLLLGLIF
jgi:hypothetical protein